MYLQALSLFPLTIANPLSPSHLNDQAPIMSPSPTIYFGYGSNLWLEQMSIRCPDSLYLGIARLNGYKWLINDRGYANVVSSNSTEPAPNSSAYDNVVYGMVYSLTEDDEKKLDRNEGVPVAYTKEMLECDFWSAGEPTRPLDEHEKIDVGKPVMEMREMLVYIDQQRVRPDVPRKEYVYRMNQGINNAVKLGVPEEYVEEVMRKFIPADEGGEESMKMEEFAKGQAAQFKDESGVFQ